jgi:long-chain acyl-CoA synthetase
MSAVAERPWLRFYGDVPASLDYPEVGLYDAVAATAARLPDAIAYDFLGSQATYRELLADIDRCADALGALGLHDGDRITISMPTSPQGVIAFYAAAKVGAVASMIHPLSTSDEIAGYLELSRSRAALTLDAFYGAFAELRDRTPLETLILARIPDYLSPLKRLGFWWTRGRKLDAVPKDARVVWWSRLLDAEHPAAAPAAVDPHGLAALLYSGGTTGAPKGIMLSHHNFVSEALQVIAWVGIDESDTILGALPIFHGFGLGALVHAGFTAGAKVVMVPVFSPETVAKVMREKRPTLMAGVPTLYEALCRGEAELPDDLSCLRAAFCGADTLTRPVKERFEGLVADRHGSVRLLEGYGLTEAVTAIMGTPLQEYREGSVGVPFPDMLAMICEPGAETEVPHGEVGEICVSGPPVMLGYLDNPEATAEALRTHADGRVWLHTGDLGRRDDDGFFYFVSRLKRMIKSSGFNVFPAQVEQVLIDHPAVVEACVIGVPDASQGERVKAYVVPADGAEAGPALADELIEHCRAHLIKWSCPREVEFRTELPLTRVGKIDYALLTRQAAEAAKA